MARIDKTGTLAQTRGRQGGIVVSSNATAGYVSAFKMPRRPRSYEQWISAERFSRFCRLWSELPAADKADWSAEAVSALWTRQDWFGQPYQPSGLNLYVMISMWHARLGLVSGVPLPTGTLPAATVGFTAVTSGGWTTFGTNNVLLTATQSPALSYRYLLFDSDLRRGTGTNEMRGQYRPMDQWDLYGGGTRYLYGGNAADGSCFFRNLVMPWRAVFLTEDLKPAAAITGTYRSPTV
jgi:hypothetical protein